MKLQILQAQRDAERQYIQTYLQKLEDAKSDDNRVQYETIFKSLEQKVSHIASLNEKILSSTDLQGINEEIVSTNDYTLQIECQLAECRVIRDKWAPSIEPNALPVASDSNPITQPSIAQVHSSQLTANTVSSATSQYHRLPKLALPTFDGDILKWQGFWDSFESTVHMNPNLTDVQRFNYLKAQLESDAARTIEGFSISNANYTRALELLQERYGQQHKIVHATMKALLKIPPPTSSLSHLRAFYDSMETYIRGLESIGRYHESYGELLVPIVLDKLPKDIRKNLARERTHGNWQLDELRKALYREICIEEAGASAPELHQYTPEVSQSYGSAVSFFTDTRQKSNGMKSGQSTITPSNQRLDNSNPKCAFCNNQHKSINCTTYKDAASRVTVVKRRKLCYNCLGPHPIKNCKSKWRCQKCHKRHHTSICEEQTNQSDPATSRVQQEVTNNRPEAAVLHSHVRHSPSAVLLKTAISAVCSKTVSVEAPILLDEGSHRSFITRELAQQLELPVTGSEEVSLSTFGGSNHTIQHLDQATVYVMTHDKKKIPVNVLVVPMIAREMKNLHVPEVASLPYLRNLKLAHPVSYDATFTISLLIGADHYWDVVEDEVVRGNGPTAVKSKIGYLLSGPLKQTYPSNQIEVFNVMTSHIQEDKLLERFWNLESIGITQEPDNLPITTAMKQYQDTSISYHEGKYTAMLPWKQDHPELPLNYSIALRRTENTINRLRKDPSVLQKYGEIIAEQERRGFIEKLPNDKQLPLQGHYIPHHPVKKASATTPIRIVYDCSCREARDQPSLNDCLESTAPDLNSLTTLILRFRLRNYAVTADIEKAFLRVGLHEQDRDYTRFLWLSDPENPDSELITYRFKVILFGATCSPYILNATILKHLHRHSDVPAAAIIERDLYVDNVLSSFDTEQEVVSFYREGYQLMSKADMKLRSWTSNSSTLRDYAADDNLHDTDEMVKVLGLGWFPTTDIMTFVKREIPVTNRVTKRFVLKQSSQIYDPLGMLSPVTVRAKLLMQDLWKCKYEWDERIPDNMQKTWQSIAMDLNTVMTMSFPRKLLARDSNDGIEKRCLHVFVDASTRSYGAVAYICDDQDSAFLMAKNRVSPLKTLTLPKLELMSALIGARLSQHLVIALPDIPVFYWCDSQIVLSWLQTTKPLNRFVANRVDEIKQLTVVNNWRYCPTRDNPADLLTRGITAHKFIGNTHWLNGPSWICDQARWPWWESEKVALFNIIETQTTSTENPRDNQSPQNNLLFCIHVEKYSTYRKLLRITAYVLRFVHNVRSSVQDRDTNQLRARDLGNAELRLIQACQHKEFEKEIESIVSKRNQPTLVKQLRLFIDAHGTVRCGGRIHNAPVDDMTKFPILLPKKHHLTQLIVIEAHRFCKHAGVNATVTNLRQKFWIPSIRQCVKSITRKCNICRRVTSRPYSAPEPPPLPAIRVSDGPPFSVTGVDFTGALYVREQSGVENKAYICLFTCATTRAVHLEVVTSLSEESFLNAFRRFVSRRSLPSILVSDNATTFQASAKHLRNLFHREPVNTELSQLGVEWRFIPKRAPWFGGWWERLIGLTKTTLKKILGRAYVNLEQLQTIVTEIEAFMNDRPLTHVSSNLSDPDPLTPAHLLYGRRMTSLPHNNVDETTHIIPDVHSRDIETRVKRVKEIITHYTKRWKTEYLTSLREFHKSSGNNNQTIKPGDVVQVHDDKPRVQWKLAVVENLLPGHDGRSRAARIRTSGGLQTTRPIVKLYPLEIL